MKPNYKVARTIAAILGASALHAALAADTGAVSGSTQLREIIVTATRRTESVQNVPLTVQVLTGRTLSQLHVKTLSDYLKYLPDVSTATLNPGAAMVFMRGLSLGAPTPAAQGSVGEFPNVAIYLDNESTLLPGRALDVYAVDLQRIEVLEGPQGTLFGAGAQAGAIRYITNKPKLDTLEVDVSAGYGITAHGDPNHHVSAVFNWPIIPGKLAARLVWFDDHRGGYINNLPATFSRSGTDLGIAQANGGIVPTNSVSINNYQIAGNGINPLDYGGGRLELKYKINDDWSVLLSQMYQDMNAQGVFYQMPYGTEGAGETAAGLPVGTRRLPPLSVNLFNPSFDRDKFSNTALTVDGEVGPLSIVYAGSYLDRNLEQVQDYTNYARGRYAYYYQCTGVTYSSTSGNPGATCLSPRAVWRDKERNTHVQQELRVSTPSTWRLRAIAGIFYEDLKIYDDQSYLYTSLPGCAPSGPTSNCFLPLQTWPGAPSNQPGPRNSATSFIDDFQRTFIQKAAYTSVSFDIIPHKLTITGGIRYFDMYNASQGGDVSGFGCKQFTPTSYFGPCLTSYGTNVSQQNPHAFVETGHRGRASLSWHITPEAMVYYTYSQGFRPGGFNHGSSAFLPDQIGVMQYYNPKAYQSDNLTNNEIGWKAFLLDHRIRFNGTLYQENWSNVQTEVFCPQCGLGNVIFITNGPQYRVRGVELQIDARVMRGLTVYGSTSVHSGELTNSPALIDNNPASPDFGKPITTRYANGVAYPVTNVYGLRGSDLANSPSFQASLRARYDWTVGPYLAYVQAGFQHSGSSLSATGFVATFRQPSWTTYDASAGIAKGDWTLSLAGTNLTNVNKSLLTSSALFTLTETPMRPRVIELTFNYHFSRHE